MTIGSRVEASIAIDLSYVAPSSVGQRPPAGDGRVPGGALRGVRAGRATYSNVVSSGAMSPARAPPSMLMLQIVIRCSMVRAADRLAAVLEDVAGPAADADPGDEREDDVLGADPGLEPAVHPDLVGLRPALEQALGGEDHLDLARADPEREGPERAVRGGVAVAADDRHPGLGQAELGPDDVDDALVRAADPVERDPELVAVRRQLVDLGRGHLVEDRQVARMGRDRVVGRRDRLARAANA